MLEPFFHRIAGCAGPCSSLSTLGLFPACCHALEFQYGNAGYCWLFVCPGCLAVVNHQFTRTPPPLSSQSPILYFDCIMRGPSFLLALFLIVGYLLPISFASPLASGGMARPRDCGGWLCKEAIVSPEGTSTSTPSATSTPTLEHSALAPQSTPASKTGSSLSSANAGVALASHGTLLCTVLAGWLATVLAF
ncbi:hypothetical protein BJV74DRAFT_50042 [Russula compacta]|nr:hypothetical protein BJV74DRAFT_50042 [Russula compacta]